MHKLSLSPLTVLPCSPVEQIDAAHKAGFDSVGLRLFPSLPTDVDVMADRPLQRDIKRRLEDTQLEVLDIEVVRVSPRMDLAPIEAALEFAGGLGARWLAATSESRQDYRTEDEPSLVGRLAELCETAERHGMGVMLEFMAFRGISTLQDAVRIVTATGSPNLAITVDALHLFRSGGTADAIATVDPALLACVQLCDAPQTAPADLIDEARQNRLYPGEGDLPLTDLMRMLPANIPVSVEVPSRSRAHLSAHDRAAHAARSARPMIPAPSL